MDKNTLVGFVLIGAVLIGFSYWNRPSQEEMEKLLKCCYYDLEVDF